MSSHRDRKSEPSRRDFLAGSSALMAAGAGLGMPRVVKADSSDHPRKFIFVFAIGGWDQTMSFCQAFGNANVDIEDDAEPATAGNIPYVDHPDRPSLRTFMEHYHSRMLVVNGVVIPSANHEICRMITMTGSTAGDLADWPTIIGAARADKFDVPHLLLSGLTFPGNLGVSVTRTGPNGQLQELLSGQNFLRGSIPVTGPSPPAESVMDDYVRRRAEARLLGARSPHELWLAQNYQDSMERLDALKTHRYTMNFASGTSLTDQMQTAVAALSTGVSRSVTVSLDGWDTHSYNIDQVWLYEDLFAALSHLLFLLDTTPGEYGGMLADETNVVVLSEMGRFPLINVAEGKDHWAYTHQMFIGPDFQGDRVIGAYDTYLNGVPVDAKTGDVTDTGSAISMGAIGSVLLNVAGLDHEEYIQGIEPLWSMLG